MDVNDFFIKDGYCLNPVKTFDIADSDKYWTEERLKTSEYLQYHVYEFAYRLFTKKHLNSVIDVGSGPGLKTKHFFERRGTEVYLLDQPTTKVITDKTFPNASFVTADLSKPYDLDRKFDLVICADVIEHLENPDILLETLRGLCKENGYIVLSTPDRDMRRGLDNNQSPNPEHVREWNFSEFSNYIRSRDFIIEEHVNLPSIKLNKRQLLLHKLLYKKINKTTWYPCQTLIAKTT